MSHEQLTEEIKALTIAFQYIQRRANTEHDRELAECSLTIYQLINGLREMNAMFISTGGRS